MANSTTGTVALFGAAGAIGHSLASELQSRGIPYRAIGRDAERLRRDFPGATPASADFFTGEGVREAAGGIDTIFYLAGAPYTEFFKHPIMVRNALGAAQAAGVKRFVHVAPVYSYGAPLTHPVAENRPHVPNTRKGRFRLEQEQAVLERNAPGFATLVVHLPDFYGPHADLSYANAFMREALSVKTASFIGPPDVQREFIFVPDAAAPLLGIAALDDAYGRRWNLGGESIQARDFANAVFAALGTPPRFRAVPTGVLRIAGVGGPLMREVAEMYYLFDSGFVLDDAALRQRLGEWKKTPFIEGIAETIAWMC